MDVALLSVSRLCRLRPLLGAVSRNLSTGTFVNPNNAKERKESDNSLAYVSCFPFTDRNCNTVTQVSYENASQSNCQSPLVIQHPLFGRKENHSSLGRMISHLTKRTVVIPDARNHGNSPKCDNPSIKQMSTDLVDFQKQLKIRQSCLLGFSTGGRVAMMTALLHPQSGGNIVMLRWRRVLEHNFS